MERGKHKVKVLELLGEHHYNGRTYKLCRVRITDTGDEYVSLRLYNAKRKFIKQFMIEPEAVGEVGQLLLNSAPVFPVEHLPKHFPHLFYD